MGTFNGNAQGGRFTATRSAKKRDRKLGAGMQILLSLLLLFSLFMVYTMLMQATHQQGVMELSRGVTLGILAFFTLAAGVLLWAVIYTKAWKRCVCLLLIFVTLWAIAAFSNIPLVKKYRDLWVSTALSTMRHQGLATFYFPPSVIQERRDMEAAAREAQAGDNTLDTFNGSADEHNWIETEGTGPVDPNDPTRSMTREQREFYGLFYELDVDSAEAYFHAHPESLANGYAKVDVNESSLRQEGTSIRTKLGEKVLAIDAANQILIVEVDADGSRGVLAIGKLPSRLHLCAAANIGSMGETAGSIAQRNNGVLAITGSGFIDEGGVGNGGQIAGYAMCDGKSYGYPYGWGYKRMELHENDWLYITDAVGSVSSDTTDAMEFTPALLTNGKKLDPGIWTSQNPRACIGQSERGEILMLAVEGRSLSSPGCSVTVCADILLEHDGITAINCDGGTTAMLWYKGNPLIRCSNTAIPEGRHLPDAWVYQGE